MASIVLVAHDTDSSVGCENLYPPPETSCTPCYTQGSYYLPKLAAYATARKSAPRTRRLGALLSTGRHGMYYACPCHCMAEEKICTTNVNMRCISSEQPSSRSHFRELRRLRWLQLHLNGRSRRNGSFESCPQRLVIKEGCGPASNGSRLDVRRWPI